MIEAPENADEFPRELYTTRQRDADAAQSGALNRNAAGDVSAARERCRGQSASGGYQRVWPDFLFFSEGLSAEPPYPLSRVRP